jgi:hypothetical protein
MTTAKTIERTLRKTGIFPPSVQDSHYGDKAEMSREEIIEKTLGEMSLFSSLEQGSQSSNKADHLSTVILELQRRLPPGKKIKTCGAFKHLNAGCCDSCHTSRPHTDMNLIDLPDRTKAWVCCAVEWAIYPERYVKLMERSRNCPEGELFRELFGDHDPKEH